MSWTHALRQIVINCYKYHGREDLLPAFTEDDDKGPPTQPVSLVSIYYTTEHVITACPQSRELSLYIICGIQIGESRVW